MKNKHIVNYFCWCFIKVNFDISFQIIFSIIMTPLYLSLLMFLILMISKDNMVKQQMVLHSSIRQLNLRQLKESNMSSVKSNYQIITRDKSMETKKQKYHIMRREVIERKKQCGPLFRYFFNKKKGIMLKMKSKDHQNLATFINSIRGVLLLSIVNNARFCIEDDNYFSVMEKSLKILKCGNVTNMDNWDEDFTKKWIKQQDCEYYIKKNTEITVGYDVSVDIFHCDNFIDDILINTKQLNTKRCSEIATGFLFQPDRRIINNVQSVLSTLRGILIGINIDLNNGYNCRNKNETADNAVISLKKKIVRFLSRFQDDYTIYLSSRNPNIKAILADLHKPLVTVESILQSLSLKEHTYVRDLYDIYILSLCEILIYTLNSSQGMLARQLSSSNQIFTLKI